MGYGRSRKCTRVTFMALISFLFYLLFISLPTRSNNHLIRVPTEVYDETNNDHKLDQYEYIDNEGEESQQGSDDDIRGCLKAYAKTDDYMTMVQCIKDYNIQGTIRNSDQFTSKPTVVISLIVHKRALYLTQLLNHLREAKGIENVLLIVSHDGYYTDMVDIVKSVRFCRVLQLFHPFAAHITRVANDMYKRGGSKDVPSSCSSRQGSGAKRLIECDLTSPKSSFIDDERFKQTAAKHHYWWLWNFVYRSGVVEKIMRIPDFQVLYLEEDHIVTPDILYALDGLLELRNAQCPECFGIVLGFHDTDFDRVDIKRWKEAQYNVLLNIGMSFNRTAFMKILRARKEFCSFNDYNWDLTFGHMGNVRSIPDASLSVRLSRVYHIGSCGMHAKSDQCSPELYVGQVKDHVTTPLLNDITREAQENGMKLYDYYKMKRVQLVKEWRDEPYSERDGSDGVEGWLNGRLWDPHHKQVIKEFWESTVNEEHCYQIAETEKAWSH
ncbi:hypothetical protein MP638_000830 [Amoeboaphelidium occidentale]|nr:hypothetical protein MP638_000830 [Amoeboaphelidium occidentale]